MSITRSVRRRFGKIGQQILGKNYRTVRMSFSGAIPLSMPENASVNSRKVTPKNVSDMSLRFFFHKEYYESQTGTSFASKATAIDHFLKYGMKRKLSPHPLISFAYLPEATRRSYLMANSKDLVDFLATKRSLERPLGPLLDFTKNESLKVHNTALDFLMTLKKTTIIKYSSDPATNDHVTYGSAAQAVIQATTGVMNQRKLHGESMSKEWDAEYEKSWLLDVESRAIEAEREFASHEPVVSIVMPVWNRPEAVLTAIESVQRQNLTNWEIIIIDDGSTDNTVDVIKTAMESDSRIRLFTESHNGVCAARNVGIANAKGRFVAFLDSDNSWRENFLRIMIVEMIAKDLECAFSAIRISDSNNGVRYLGTDFVSEQLLIRNYVDMNTLVVGRSILNEISGFDTSLRRMVDHDLVIRISNLVDVEYFPFIGCDYFNEDESDRISTSESENWQYAVFGRNVVDWGDLSRKNLERQSDLLSIVIPMWQNPKAVARTVESLMGTLGDRDFEIIVVDNYSSLDDSVSIVAALHGNSRVRVIRQRKNYGFSVAANIGFSESNGKYVVFVQPGIWFKKNWASLLLAEVSKPEVIACQPLLVEPDGTICSAGYVYPANRDMPVFFLDKLPIEDAGEASILMVSGVSSAVFAVSAEDFIGVNGFDTLFLQGLEDADLSMRLLTSSERKIVCVTGSVAVRENECVPARTAKHWAEDLDIFQNRWNGKLPSDLGEALLQTKLDLGSFHPGRVDKAIRDRVVLRRGGSAKARLSTGGNRSLRWSIKIGAKYTDGQDKWGDVFFAEDLASSLRKLGQEVVIDRADAFDRESSHLDDVTLTIRGFKPFRPQAGRVNLMWVISRPDQVTPKEVARFDHVFGASQQWSERMSKRANVEVETLLQATNPERFHPTSSIAYPSADLVFVGGPRPPLGRKIIVDCLESGIGVSVWGPRWGQFVPQEMIAGDFVDNEFVSGVYRNSRILLNDHFEDMASNGFINNRIFDAVASGARVLSDDVNGITEIFGSAVQVYRTPEDLIRLTGSGAMRYFADDAEMDRISSKIRHDHSFDARAQVLLDRALLEMDAKK